METTTRETAGTRIDLYSKLLRKVLCQGRIRLLQQLRRVVARQVPTRVHHEGVQNHSVMHINLQEEEEIEIEYLKYVRMVDCSCESYYIGCDDGKFDDSSEHVAEFSLLEDNNGLSVEVVGDSSGISTTLTTSVDFIGGYVEFYDVMDGFVKVKMEMTGNSWCPRRALHPGLYQQLRGGEGFLELHPGFVTIETEVFFTWSSTPWTMSW